MILFNRLIVRMGKMLNELRRAIKGLVVMSAELDAMSANFLFQQVPGPWGEKGVGYPSLKPLASWFKDFVLCVNFESSWLCSGEPPSFWISALFFPQGFMTAALQTYARKYRHAIDKLLFRTVMQEMETPEDCPEPPVNGVYVYGMFMEGASWDRNQKVISESNPGELYNPAPLIWLEPVDESIEIPSTDYDCPFYKTNV